MPGATLNLMRALCSRWNGSLKMLRTIPWCELERHVSLQTAHRIQVDLAQLQRLSWDILAGVLVMNSSLGLLGRQPIN